MVTAAGFGGRFIRVCGRLIGVCGRFAAGFGRFTAGFGCFTAGFGGRLIRVSGRLIRVSGRLIGVGRVFRICAFFKSENNVHIGVDARNGQLTVSQLVGNVLPVDAHRFQVAVHFRNDI